MRFFKLQKNTKKPIEGLSWKDSSNHYYHKPAFQCAVICGKISGITVVDVDSYKNEVTREWYNKWQDTLLDTMTISTPSGGTHHYFKYEAELATKHGKNPDIDLQNDNSYVVAHGSKLDGAAYRLVNDKQIGKMPESLKNVFFFKKQQKNGFHQTINAPIAPLIDKIKKIYPHGKVYEYPSIYSYGPIRCDKCPDGIVHSSNNTYAKYSKRKKYWYLQCLDDDCDQIKVPINIDEELATDFDIKTFNKIKSFERSKMYFEKFHFKLMKPYGIFCRRYHNDIDDTDEFDLLSREQMIKTYEPLRYDIDETKTNRSFIKAWMEYKDIKWLKGITFSPLITNVNYFNLFTGFRYEKYKRGDVNYIEEIKDLMKMLVGHDEIGFTKLSMYLADIPQRPNTKKFGKCLVFIGEQGTGKTCFWDWFGEKIIGSDYYHISANIDHYTGQFAPGIFQKLLCVLEEVSGKDSFENAEKLKDAVTGKKIGYEQKYKDPVTVKNLARFVYLSNNETPAKIEQTDRRYEPFEVSSEKRGDVEYWTRINEVVFNHEPTIMAFVDWLLSLSVNQYSWVEHDNKVKKDMALSTTPITIRFLMWLCDPTKLSEYIGDNSDFYISDLVERYNDFRVEENAPPTKSILLGKRLRKLKLDGFTWRVGGGRNKIYNIDFRILNNALNSRYG